MLRYFQFLHLAKQQGLAKQDFTVFNTRSLLGVALKTELGFDLKGYNLTLPPLPSHYHLRSLHSQNLHLLAFHAGKGKKPFLL